mgnify:CR=1 FL=1
MKATIKNFFSITITEEQYFRNIKPKFEIVHCPSSKNCCEEILPSLNENYFISQQFYLDKEYQHSIEALKKTYNKTFEIDNPSCNKCAALFRSTIHQSMEDIKREQDEMSNSFFNNRN